MDKQKGFGVLLVILGVFGVMVLGTAGAAGLVLLGKAPACETRGGTARTEDAIGDTLEAGAVTITDSEATTLSKRYLGDVVKNPGVCFTQGEGHVSGQIDLGAIKPSFYVSGGVNLSGSTPRITNLKIQLGSLPNNPVISALAQNAVNKALTESLGQISLDQVYFAKFTKGSLTIMK